MLTFTLLTEENHIDDVRRLYEASFPADQRRDWWQFMHIFRNEPRFRCLVICDGLSFRGFLCHWLLDSVVYVEHFAVLPEYRGNSDGSAALEHLKSLYAQPLLLEAENPDACADRDIALRRLAFYERHGFRVFKRDYLQPIYRAGDQQVPLVLLTTGNGLSDDEVEKFCATVYAPVDTLLHYEDEVDSTNSELIIRNARNPLPDKFALYTFSQPHGRGQRGNTWEAQQDKNLLISWLLRPEIKVQEQFRLSEAVCLIFLQWLEQVMPAGKLSIKWPNDIYYDDLKIGGVLIEHVVIGDRIDHSIVGVGFNINQLEFPADLPNPVSIIQVTRKHNDLHTLAIDLNAKLGHYAEWLSDSELHNKYLARLYRRDGLHRYRLPDGSGFKAQIVDVRPNGMLVLEDEGKNVREFAFKEVIFTH
ncbi:MAG: biotin--[Paludibacteraceae bacterium]|nr:biotin--[acetyl-CoA-carboxylase] ligase [Paludibacteraceae bacterium]